MNLINMASGTLVATLLATTWCAAQTKNHSIQSSKNKTMTIVSTQEANKEAIYQLYEQVLNNRKLERLDDFIDPAYTGAQGVKGIAAFKKAMQDLHTAFPDGHWAIETIVAEDNTVMVKQKLTGTHTGPFQQIAPTGKKFISNGVGIYEFKEGRIIASQLQTDRLGFFQQIGVLPERLPASASLGTDICFIDKFIVPQRSLAEFTTRMQYNRDFVATLPGYISGDVYEQKDDVGNMTIITVAVWDTQKSLDNAKAAVQAEFKRVGFNPLEFYERLGIPLERGLFSKRQD